MGNAGSEHESQTRRKFDAWAESATFKRLTPWLMFMQGRVLDRVDWGNASRALDVACGSGWAVHEAASRLGPADGAIACGCDISIGMLSQRMATRGDARVSFLVASAMALPYESGQFDAVMCTAAFHHFPSPKQALREFWRVLRPGGAVLIADTCRDQSLGTWVWDRLHRWFEEGHQKYYRRDELWGLLEETGFSLEEMIELKPSYAATKKLVRRAALLYARKL